MTFKIQPQTKAVICDSGLWEKTRKWDCWSDAGKDYWLIYRRSTRWTPRAVLSAKAYIVHAAYTECNLWSSVRLENLDLGKPSRSSYLKHHKIFTTSIKNMYVESCWISTPQYLLQAPCDHLLQEDYPSVCLSSEEGHLMIEEIFEVLIQLVHCFQMGQEILQVNSMLQHYFPSSED